MMRTWFLRVRALCLFLAGDDTGAGAVASDSMARDPSGGNAATSLWQAVQAGCALRDGDAIRAALDATLGLRGRWTGLVRATAQAGLASLDHDEGASAVMSGALDAWISAGLPLDHALATLCAIHVMPTEGRPTEHVQRARTYLTDLHAESLLRLYDAATEG